MLDPNAHPDNSAARSQAIEERRLLALQDEAVELPNEDQAPLFDVSCDPGTTSGGRLPLAPLPGAASAF